MKYTPGLMVGQLSKKAGSTVAAHNRFGSYFRTRVIPTNPSTAKQTNFRTHLANFSQNYRALTSTQRTDWTTLGALMTRVDSLGNTYNLTGLQAFIGVNLNHYVIGGAQITTAPAYAPPVAPASIVVTAAAGTPALSIAYTATPVPAATSYVIQATAQVSAGRRFMPRSAYKYIAKISATTASPYDALAEYNATFGTLVAGYKIFFRILAIGSASGLASTVLEGNVVVAA